MPDTNTGFSTQWVIYCFHTKIEWRNSNFITRQKLKVSLFLLAWFMRLPNMYLLFLMSGWKIMWLVVTNLKMRCSNSQHTSHKSKLPTGTSLNYIKKRTWLCHGTFACMLIPLLKWRQKFLAGRVAYINSKQLKKTQQTIDVSVLITSCLKCPL